MEGQQIFVPLCSSVGITIILVFGFRLISHDLISDVLGLLSKNLSTTLIFLGNQKIAHFSLLTSDFAVSLEQFPNKAMCGLSRLKKKRHQFKLTLCFPIYEKKWIQPHSQYQLEGRCICSKAITTRDAISVLGGRFTSFFRKSVKSGSTICKSQIAPFL